MLWWHWMILGGVVLGAELFAVDAQFYLVFIGLSAALVGLAELLGIAMPGWVQFTTFAVLSLILCLTFRKMIYEKIRGGATGYRETISGDTVTIEEDLTAGSEARTEFRGTKWTVRNAGTALITAGTRAKVVKVEGLTLYVEGE
jgi:membrane protein implicated in regulation of membrane protease activity